MRHTPAPATHPTPTRHRAKPGERLPLAPAIALRLLPPSVIPAKAGIQGWGPGAGLTVAVLILLQAAAFALWTLSWEVAT